MERIELNLKIYPEKILRKKAKLVKSPNEWHQKILTGMLEIMYKSRGVGLAGPQVGIDQALIVVDAGNKIFKFINPRIVKKEGVQVNEEGCLSIPGILIKVKRAKKIILEALNEYFEPIKLEAEDLLACIIQHEVDHLEGRLIIDYASLWDKIKIKNKLKKINKERKKENERMS